MLDNKICKHEELEKINDSLYICRECSLIGIVKEITANETKIKLLSKYYKYNIKNEINIFDITKNAINYYMDKPEVKINQKKDDISMKNMELYLKFRNKLIKHVYNLCTSINSTYECYYLAIILMDNVINNLNYIINNYQLDLINTICFIISKKFIEKDILKAENYKQYLTICHSPQKFINPIDLINEEVECLKILKYNLNIPTSLTLLKYIFICGIIFADELEEKEIKKIYDDCFEILGFCIEQNDIYINFNPVQIVFGIIYYVRKKNNFKKNIFKYFNDLFDIKFNYIKECTKVISKLYYDKNCKNDNNNNNVIKQLDLKNNNIYRKNKNYSAKKINTNSNTTSKNNEKMMNIQINNMSPKKFHYSPIIRIKTVYTPIIKNFDFGSENRLSPLNLEDRDKYIDDNSDRKNVVIVKNNDLKKNKSEYKCQFFRSNKDKKKIYNNDIKNSYDYPYSCTTTDINAFIEKISDNKINI